MKFVVLLSVLLTATGCGVTEEMNTAAVKHQKLLKVLRAASAPADDVETDVWMAGWDEAERGAALFERGTR